MVEAGFTGKSTDKRLQNYTKPDIQNAITVTCLMISRAYTA